MIEFDNVTFTYGEEATIGSKVEDITFSVKEGECAVFCGRSGSGKSTLLRLISGLAPGFYEGVLNGKISVNEKEPSEYTSEQRAKTFGLVFQDPRSQFFMDVVQDEIVFSAENIGREPQTVLERLHKSVKFLDIEDLLQRSTNELSSGQKQRVAVAAALCLEPPILILDEPVSNLDPGGVEKLLEVLKKIKKQGTTIIVSEHRLHQFAIIADNYFHINGGKLEHIWEKKEFLDLSCEECMQWGLRHPDMTRENMGIKENINSKLYLTGNSLCYSYKHSGDGVNEIDFQIPHGSVIALSGENGAGKTTLCKMLCGLLKPQKGEISLCDKPLSGAKRRSISYLVMQDADYQLYSDSVVNEIILGKKVTEELKNRVYKALDLFRLSGLKERHPASLSGGEKQRVTMAAAYCSTADIFVLDEPTSGMDGEGLMGIVNWVNILKKEGKTVVIITHDELLSRMACDREIFMKEGKIVHEERCFC